MIASGEVFHTKTSSELVASRRRSLLSEGDTALSLNPKTNEYESPSGKTKM